MPCRARNGLQRPDLVAADGVRCGQPDLPLGARSWPISVRPGPVRTPNRPVRPALLHERRKTPDTSDMSNAQRVAIEEAPESGAGPRGRRIAVAAGLALRLVSLGYVMGSVRPGLLTILPS